MKCDSGRGKGNKRKVREAEGEVKRMVIFLYIALDLCLWLKTCPLPHFSSKFKLSAHIVRSSNVALDFFI